AGKRRRSTGSESFKARARGSRPPGSRPLQTSPLALGMTVTRGSADTLGLRFTIARRAHGERQAEEPDEAFGMGRIKARHVEAGEAREIQGFGTVSATRRRLPAEQLHRDLAGRGLERLVDERLQGLAQWREPLAVVDEIRHARRELGACAQDVVWQSEPAEILER